jgi:hypothetical protein
MRRGIFNTMLHGKRLFQQYVVDMYIKIESTRLDYIRNHQKEIRADLYPKVLLIVLWPGSMAGMK